MTNFGVFGWVPDFGFLMFSLFYQLVAFFCVPWHGDCLCIRANGINFDKRKGGVIKIGFKGNAYNNPLNAL